MLNEQVRALVVDDAFQRDDRIDEILMSAGFEIRVVADSVSAIGALEVWRPAVVIVDLRFPSREAHLFCAALAARADAGEVSLVLVAEGPNLLKPTPTIPSGLVPTPIDPAHLVATVARVTRAAADARAGSIAGR